MSTREIDPNSFKVPDGFKQILQGYLKEVLRYQPEDIASFSRDYFAALAENQLDAFLRSQAERMIAKAGPDTNGYKTLQDYSINLMNSSSARVVARPPLEGEEDPTEREIREMNRQIGNARAHMAVPEPVIPAAATAAAATATSAGYGATAVDAHYQDSPRQQQVDADQQTIDELYQRSQGLRPNAGMFRQTRPEEEDDQEILQLQAELKRIEQDDERRRSIMQPYQSR